MYFSKKIIVSLLAKSSVFTTFLLCNGLLLMTCATIGAQQNQLPTLPVSATPAPITTPTAPTTPQSPATTAAPQSAPTTMPTTPTTITPNVEVPPSNATVPMVQPPGSTPAMQPIIPPASPDMTATQPVVVPPINSTTPPQITSLPSGPSAPPSAPPGIPTATNVNQVQMPLTAVTQMSQSGIWAQNPTSYPVTLTLHIMPSNRVVQKDVPPGQTIQIFNEPLNKTDTYTVSGSLFQTVITKTLVTTLSGPTSFTKPAEFINAKTNRISSTKNWAAQQPGDQKITLTMEFIERPGNQDIFEIRQQ